MAPMQPKNEVIHSTLPITISRSGYFDIISAAILMYFDYVRLKLAQYIFTNANVEYLRINST